jgi:hypothetical protein
LYSQNSAGAVPLPEVFTNGSNDAVWEFVDGEGDRARD